MTNNIDSFNLEDNGIDEDNSLRKLKKVKRLDMKNIFELKDEFYWTIKFPVNQIKARLQC